MDTQKEKDFLMFRNKLLSEIETRESILSELERNKKDKKGFIANFVRGFLKYKKDVPNIFWLNNETYGRYLIDSDNELISDIQNAFRKSIEKMKLDYKDSLHQAE